MKRCTRCRVLRKTDAFLSKSLRPKETKTCDKCRATGLRYFKNANPGTKAHKIKIIKERLHKIKMDKGCRVKGCVSDVLEFDHVKGSKGFDIGSFYMKMHSWEKIQYEIDKCEVVCRFHHRIKSSQDTNIMIGPRKYDAHRVHWRRITNTEIVNNEFKIGKKCSECELVCTSDTVSGFDFDHIDPPTKIKSISDAVPFWCKKRLISEIMKCRLICANCHFKKPIYPIN